MTSRKNESFPQEVSIRRYYDEYYRRGDFNHYPEQIDLAYFHAILMYFSILGDSSILDGGCGTGVRMERMQKLGLNVTGIDVSITGLEQKRSRDRTAKLIQGDMLGMPFGDNVFDAVIALGCSLINTNDTTTDRAMVLESLRVVKPGGWVIATTVTDFSGDSPSGWIYRTKASLNELTMSVNSSDHKVIFTAPGLAAKMPRFAMSTVCSRMIEFLPRLKRTVIMGWRK